MPEFKRKKDRENWEALQEFDKEVSAFKKRLESTRTRAGIGEDQVSKEFFRIIEIAIELSSSDLTLSNITKNQVKTCVELVDGFDIKHDDIVSSLSSLKSRVQELEAPAKQKAAVGKFFDSIYGKITKVIAWFAVISTILTHWVNVMGLL